MIGCPVGVHSWRRRSYNDFQYKQHTNKNESVHDVHPCFRCCHEHSGEFLNFGSISTLRPHLLINLRPNSSVLRARPCTLSPESSPAEVDTLGVLRIGPSFSVYLSVRACIVAVDILFYKRTLFLEILRLYIMYIWKSSPRTLLMNDRFHSVCMYPQVPQPKMQSTCRASSSCK